MFYCEVCQKDNDWPGEYYLPTSRGKCEMCGKTVVCFDVPSKFLPPSKPRKS